MTDELDTSVQEIQDVDHGSMDSDEDTPYLGTWKTRDEADRGISEMQKTMAKFQSEKDKALAKAEQLERDFFSKVVGGVNGPAPTQPTVDVDKIKKEIASRIEDGGDSAIVDLIYDLTGDIERVAEEKSTSKTKELQAELKAMREELMFIRPENARVKDKVDELAEEFPHLARTDLVKMAKKLVPDVSQPPRPMVPGNTGSSIGGTSGLSTGGMSAANIAAIERITGGRKLSKAELARLTRGGK